MLVEKLRGTAPIHHVCALRGQYRLAWRRQILSCMELCDLVTCSSLCRIWGLNAMAGLRMTKAACMGCEVPQL